jgi:hypothetical protein
MNPSDARRAGLYALAGGLLALAMIPDIGLSASPLKPAITAAPFGILAGGRPVEIYTLRGHHGSCDGGEPHPALILQLARLGEYLGAFG